MNSNRPIPARGLTDSAWSNDQMAGAGPCQRCGVGATTRGGCRGLIDDSFLARSSPKALGLREESVGQDKRGEVSLCRLDDDRVAEAALGSGVRRWRVACSTRR
jgi:hypothetical protein